MTTLALLPSPLLGPAVWQLVRPHLTELGYGCLSPAASADSASTPADVLTSLLRHIPPGRPVVLVPHSNAGLYAAAIAEQRDVSAIVFVDALLPPEDVGTAPTTSPEFYDFLAAKADADGLLPPWTQWWDEDISELFGSVDIRERVEREQPRLPLTYFRDRVPTPPDWQTRPCAYLAFGDTYAAQLQAATANGWPVAVIPGQHLEMTVHPRTVAGAIHSLLKQLLRGSAASGPSQA